MGRGPILKPLLIFSVSVLAALFGAMALLSLPFSWAYLGMVTWFVALTYVVHQWLERIAVLEPKQFVPRFMTVLVLKMLSSLIVVVLILVAIPGPNSIPLALAFALLYLLFLVFSTLRFSARMRSTGP